MTLYEIVEELKNFEFEIDEETGEILNADELDNLELAKDEKIENICLLIKNLKAEAVAYKAEKDSFAEKEKRVKKKAENLTNYLEKMLAGDTYKSIRNTVSYRKSETVECVDITLVPTDFLRYAEPELNKIEIKNAIKRGVDIRGCYLKENYKMSIK